MVCSSVTTGSSDPGRGGAIVGLQLITASTGAAEATARDSGGDGRQQQAAGGGVWCRTVEDDGARGEGAAALLDPCLICVSYSQV
jgi:hypothetical protein